MLLPIGPCVLGNVFKCDFEEKWSMNSKISPYFGIGALSYFTAKRVQMSSYTIFKNICHSNIKLTIEFEHNSIIPSLDILVTSH